MNLQILNDEEFFSIGILNELFQKEKSLYSFQG